MLVFKVMGKMFSLSARAGEPLQVSLKCDPDLAAALRREHPVVEPGYHLNKRHWNTVTLDGSIADDEVMSMIDDSYDLVVEGLPRSAREHLGSSPL